MFLLEHREQTLSCSLPLLVFPGNLCYHPLSQLSDLCNSVCGSVSHSRSLESQTVREGRNHPPSRINKWAEATRLLYTKKECGEGRGRPRWEKGCVSSLLTHREFRTIAVDRLSLLKWNIGCINEASTSFLKSFMFQFSSVQSLSRVQLFVTPWIAARQASLSITNSKSSLKLMSIESVIHPIVSSSVIPFSSCPQSFPASGSFPVSQLFASGGQSIGVLASTSVLPMNTQDRSPLGWTGWISLQSKGLSRVFSNTTVQKHQFFGAQLAL